MKIKVTSNLRNIAAHLSGNSQKAIDRANQASINRTATSLKTAAKRELAAEVKLRRGGVGQIAKLIDIDKATGRGKGSQTATLKFSELGVPIEITKQARTRKIRGKTGRYRVKIKGQSLVKAFKLGDNSKPFFIRSNGKLKRLYSHTLIQEATKAEVWQSLEAKAPGIFIPQFLRLVDIFDGFDSGTNSSGRKVSGAERATRTVGIKGGGFRIGS